MRKNYANTKILVNKFRKLTDFYNTLYINTRVGKKNNTDPYLGDNRWI